MYDGCLHRREQARSNSLLAPFAGCLDSVDWNGGMERWNGMEWNAMEWNGLEQPRPPLAWLGSLQAK